MNAPWDALEWRLWVGKSPAAGVTAYIQTYAMDGFAAKFIASTVSLILSWGLYFSCHITGVIL